MISLKDLTANAEVRDQLSATCDFQVASGQLEPAWFSVGGVKDFPVLARDGAGGMFVTAPGSRRILYVSSEGQAGVIAADFDALVTLVVLCPYWRDVLHFSGSGQLAEMRRAAPVLEAAWLDEEEEYEEWRAFLAEQLRLSEPDDLIGALHRMASATDIVIHGEGGVAESLFGRFTIDDNPALKAPQE